PAEFSTPVLGLIFLRYAEKKYAAAEKKLGPIGSGGRRKVSKDDYLAEGVIFLPDNARFSYLLQLTEGENIGKAINEAMKAIEDENPDLQGALPRNYTRLDNWVLMELLKLIGPVDLEGDAFGKVYEYFLGNFALKEGQKGGVFYTPTSIVRLIVEIIEPYHGRIFDPACGSGGMFVQSAEFVRRHRKNATRELTVLGTEKASNTVKLAKMNSAILRSLLHRGQSGALEQYVTGSTIKHLPGVKLAPVEVPVPPLEAQRRIAAILSAYDDLIENNTRRIAIWRRWPGASLMSGSSTTASAATKPYA